MRLETKILEQKQIEQIHKKTMEILQQTGVCVKSKIALDLLAKAGAEISEEAMNVRFTPKMISDALAKAPKSFLMGARNSAYSFEMPRSTCGHILSGITTNIVDIDSGEIRPSTKQDVIQAGRVFQTLPHGSVAWTGCSAGDMPPETHCLHEFAAILQGTSKHVQFELRNRSEAKYAVEILRAILGDDDEIRSRKIASVLYCPVSPLTHDETMLEAYLELTKYDIPVNAYPMPLMGLTSPASLFSTLCQINAEVLSALAIFQSARPGLPFIYGAASGSADPRTGDYIDGGETVLISSAIVELSRYYGLPCCVSGGASFETMPVYMAGADLIDGIGTIEGAMVTDLEKMVIHNEIAERIDRIIGGIRVDEHTDLTGDILKKGPGGGFINCKSTGKMFRDKEEFYFSKLFPDALRHSYDEENGMRKVAHMYVKEVLAGSILDELPKATVVEIEEVCSRADKELGKCQD